MYSGKPVFPPHRLLYFYGSHSSGNINSHNSITFTLISYSNINSEDCNDNDFGYLLNLPFRSLISEMIIKLIGEAKESRLNLLKIQNKDEIDIWMHDIQKLREVADRLDPGYRFGKLVSEK